MSQDAERLHKTTINHLPDELLVEIFDLYRQDIVQTYRLSPNGWSITLDWFELIHVCNDHTLFNTITAGDKGART
jgi:hypothetical protein